MPSKRSLSLIAAIFVLAAACCGAGLWLHRGAAVCVSVSVDGQEIARFDLDQDTEYLIPGYAGGTNRLIVRDGQAWVEEASCPDKLCVHQGRIRRTGEMIICLPNRMTAEIIGDEKG